MFSKVWWVVFFSSDAFGYCATITVILQVNEPGVGGASPPHTKEKKKKKKKKVGCDDRNDEVRCRLLCMVNLNFLHMNGFKVGVTFSCQAKVSITLLVC